MENKEEIPEVWGRGSAERSAMNPEKMASLDKIREVAKKVTELCEEAGIAGVFVGYYPNMGLSAIMLETPYSIFGVDDETGMPCFAGQSLNAQAVRINAKMLRAISIQLKHIHMSFEPVVEQSDFMVSNLGPEE